MRCYVCNGSGLDCSNPYCLGGYCKDESPSPETSAMLLALFIAAVIGVCVCLFLLERNNMEITRSYTNIEETLESKLRQAQKDFSSFNKFFARIIVEVPEGQIVADRTTVEHQVVFLLEVLNDRVLGSTNSQVLIQ